MGTLTFAEQYQKYIWKGTYDERFVPKDAGFRWNPTYKMWETGDTMRALRLRQYADEAAQRRFSKLIQAEAASRATDSQVDIPAPDGLSFYPFQKAGIAYVLERFAAGQSGVLLADEMGLGKTPQALGVVNALNLQRVLIVCPASLKINWLRESERWLTGGQSVAIWSTKAQPAAEVVIVNYDILSRLKGPLTATTWELVVYDESHYLKNPKAQRTKAGFSLPATRVLALTGTPILNRPVELFGTLNRLAPATFPNFMKYALRYCGAYRGEWGWDFTGATNLDELQTRLRTTCMVRRLKADVLTELPPKVRQVVAVEPDAKTQRILAAEDRLFQAEVECLGYEEAVRRLAGGGGVGFEEISALRATLAEAKIPSAIAHISDALEAGGKIIVFGHHHVLLDALAAHFGNQAVSIDGRTSMAARQQAVDRFQTDESVRLFIGGIGAAGVGLTLTAASHVILVELPWRPADVTQAEDRAHRIGQTDSVFVQHLVFDGSLDATMAKVIVAKQAVADSALDELPPEVGSLRSETEDVPQKTVSAEPLVLTPDQVEAVHENLRYLAADCDGARRKDNSGFNGLDTKFGHQLADRDFLTVKQALAARKMLFKYRGQLGERRMDAMF